MNEELVTKYLNPSPATAKGHMKRPKKGIRSTTTRPKRSQRRTAAIQPAGVQPAPPIIPHLQDIQPYPGLAYNATTSRNFIVDDELIVNVFCFGAFADKMTGVIYNDLTGNFPVMSLDGMVCFFVMYHYKTNAILATPIANLDDKSIFEEFKTNFEMLEGKGYKPKVNMMDNQATKHIKKHLTKKECKLQLVEPHNHCVNAAERVIQTFKDAFISTLATTDQDFPLQLWDKLARQVQDTLNLLRALRSKPAISSYTELNGPYNWNRYPLAPPGCKAIIYEAPAVRGSWAACGTNAWLLSASKDHYQCNLYYVPKTQAYRISGSAEIFPQHCQVPDLRPMEHLRALTAELTCETMAAACTTKGKELLKMLRTHLDDLMTPPQDPAEQPPGKQRVDADMVPGALQRVTTSPPIMQARDPMAKRNLIMAKRTHQRYTRNKTLGMVPRIQPAIQIVPDQNNVVPPPRKSLRQTMTTPTSEAIMFSPIPGQRLPNTRARLISQTALNSFVTKEALYTNQAFIPHKLEPPTNIGGVSDYVRFASPMVHPVTGHTISSYKKLMHNPATAEIWQMAFGKDFGGMAQGDDKTGQKGKNSVLVMKQVEIQKAYANNQKFTYAKIVVDYLPQKANPHRIRITAGGNLIKYKGNVSTRTADLTMSKLLWNSVLSTHNAKYMCLDIYFFYLTAALNYFEYMKMPLAVFPDWIKAQYNLEEHAHNGQVYLRIERAVWGLPQARILANKLLRKQFAPHGYYECVNTPGLWRHEWRPITFTLVVDNFGVKYVGKEHADHLTECIKEKYKLVKDWTGNLYCGIKLE